MKVKIDMTVDVDPKDWAEVYGSPSSAASVRWQVRNWMRQQALYHPDGLLVVVDPK